MDLIKYWLCLLERIVHSNGKIKMLIYYLLVFIQRPVNIIQPLLKGCPQEIDVNLPYKIIG